MARKNKTDIHWGSGRFISLWLRSTIFLFWMGVCIACCGEDDHAFDKTVVPLRSPECPSSAGLFPCEHGCAPVHVDPTNCGGCGVRCEPGEICRLGICLAAGNPSAGISDPGTWENRGPVMGGRLAGLVVGIGADPLWIVGSPGGGVWRKLDSGASWSSPAAYGLADYSAVHLERDVANSSRLYLKTWNGLYASTDNGDSWVALLGAGGATGFLPITSNLPDPKPFSQVRLDASNSLVVNSRPCMGIDYSFDGVNFTQHFPFSGGSENPDNCIGTIMIDSVSKRVYFSTLNSVLGQPAHLFRSTKAWAPGAPSLNWEPANDGLPDNALVYALTSTSVGSVGDNLLAVLHPGSMTEIWVTTDGLRWSLRSTIFSSNERALAFVLSITPANNIFLGAVRAYYSPDGGSNWHQFTVDNEHVDVRAIHATIRPGRVYTVTDGAYSMANQWNLTKWNWTSGSTPTNGIGVEETGFRIWQVFFAGVIPPVQDADPRRTFIGSMDNSALCSNDAGSSGWSPSGTFWGGDVVSFQYAPSNPERAYAWDPANSNLLRTDNSRTGCDPPNTTNWYSVAYLPGWPTFSQRNALAVDPYQQDEIYFAVTYGIIRSIDGGVTLEVRPSPGGYRPTALFIDSAGYLYAGTENGGIFKSTDDGNNWSPWGLNSSPPRAVLAYTMAGNTEWAATTSGLYRRIGSGIWILVTGGNGYIVNDVTVDPNCETRIYAAFGFLHNNQQHRGGIQFSSDNGDTWTSITAGLSLHQSPVSDVEVDRLNPRYVYAAGYGTGFWFYDWGISLPPCNP